MSNIGGVSGAQLRSFVERVEHLEEEKAAVAEQIRDVFSEARGYGFDVKILRQVLKLRKMDPGERSEHETLLDLYMQALGMVPSSTAEAEAEAA